MKRLLPVMLLSSVLLAATGHAALAQNGYLDSMQSWRNNYVTHHDLLKKPDEQALLRFFPLRADYRVVCSFERINDGDWNSIPTSGTRSVMARKYGRLTFRIHDTTLHLFTYQLQFLLAKEDTKNDLFVGFTDLTSAAETYGGGRYIDCTTDDIHAEMMVLDFNKAYNPYCAYTTGYNCPIPPRDNDLPVAVRAGEMNYGKKIH